MCPAPSGSGIKTAADEAGMSQLQPVYEQSGLVDSMQAGLPQVETSDGVSINNTAIVNMQYVLPQVETSDGVSIYTTAIIYKQSVLPQVATSHAVNIK